MNGWQLITEELDCPYLLYGRGDEHIQIIFSEREHRVMIRFSHLAAFDRRSRHATYPYVHPLTDLERKARGPGYLMRFLLT